MADLFFGSMAGLDAQLHMVGRCRFTVSTPVLKVPMASALGIII